MTLVHFAILSLRGGAFYNYYHYYADPAAMFDWLAGFGLTAPPVAEGSRRRAGCWSSWAGSPTAIARISRGRTSPTWRRA